MKTLDFYYDPGHGWLKAEMKELVELNIHDQISHYSYVSDTTVFLEEDGDAGRYLKALKERGEEFQFNEIGNAGWIRNLKPYPANRARA